MNSERMLYWFEYKKWIDSNMESARKIGRRCVEMVFRKTNISPKTYYKESDELLYIKDIFGL